MSIVWVTWLLVVIISLAGFEAYALAYGRQTLSRFVWDLSKAWPPLGWIMGLVTGFVAAHFFWGGSLICY